MSLRKTIIFLLFLLYNSLSFSQGLHIRGNSSLIDDRSSYNVFDKVTPTFNNILSISFKIIPDRPSSRGSVVRIKNDEIGAVYNLSYNGEGKAAVFKLNYEGRNTLISISLDKDVLNENQWVAVCIKFDMAKDLVSLKINETEESGNLMQNRTKWNPGIYFGRSEHVIDVPAFKLCNLRVEDNEKKYYFPLDESDGEFVHDSNKKVVGHVTNPVWLINDAYYWKKGPSFSSKKVAGSNFNSETQDIYYFNEDSLTVYNTRTGETRFLKYVNDCPMRMRLGTNFLDYENNRLYIYEVADPLSGDIVIAYLDLESLKWNAVTSEVLPAQLHHHSSYMDAEKRRYIIFGGFGRTSYFNDFYSFDLEANHWNKMNLKGDTITPRYFTSMGYNKFDNNLYVFGGMGNSAGDQTVGRMYYYELYRINLKQEKIEKLWEIPWDKENVVPVRNMVFTEDNHFYTLCYPEHFSHSVLKLYRFSVTDGQYEVLGDSISILSEKITTNANLYYNSRSQELISIVQEFDYDDVASTAKIYSIASPPVSKAQLTLYDSQPFEWKWILLALSCILILVMGLLFIIINRRKGKDGNKLLNKRLSTKYKPEEEMAIKEHPNSIYLFGEFSMIDQHNREINYMLSAKLRQAFFLILFHSLKRGISSQEFSECLWPDKTYEKAKNSRGVTINNLRKIINDLNGINLIHEKGIYKITFTDECYCDYIRCLDIVLGEKMEDNMAEFVSIISRGKFLKAEDTPLLDSFKEHVERKIESAMYFYMEKSYTLGDYSTTVSLCESIFNLDPLDEEALQYVVKALSKLDMKDEAKHRYYLFAIEYKKTLGEEYSKSYVELLK